MIHANSQTDKAQALQALREHLEEVMLLLIRLAKEVQAFKSFNAYSHVVELTAKVCRQNAWNFNANNGNQNKNNKAGRKLAIKPKQQLSGH